EGTAKAGNGPVEAMRILLGERRSAIKTKTQTMNQIHSLLITACEQIRAKYRHLKGMTLVKTFANTRPGSMPLPTPTQIAKQSLKRLASRCMQLDEQIRLIDSQLRDLVQQTNPRLLRVFGV